MKKHPLSHIDYFEIANITADGKQLDYAQTTMEKFGLLTEAGEPSVNMISAAANRSTAFFVKLQRRLQHRVGGIAAVKDTLHMLLDRRDYYGFYLYITFWYGFVEWQVPEQIILLPAVPEALECYCAELMSAFDKFLQEKEESDFSGEPSKGAAV